LALKIGIDCVQFRNLFFVGTQSSLELGPAFFQLFFFGIRSSLVVGSKTLQVQVEPSNILFQDIVLTLYVVELKLNKRCSNASKTHLVLQLANLLLQITFGFSQCNQLSLGSRPATSSVVCEFVYFTSSAQQVGPDFGILIAKLLQLELTCRKF
jgi:hypothetical protein